MVRCSFQILNVWTGGFMSLNHQKKHLCALLAALFLLNSMVLPVGATEVEIPETAAVDLPAEGSPDSVSEETLPQETVSEQADSVETLPAETIPAETVPEETTESVTPEPAPEEPEPAEILRYYQEVPLYFQTDYPEVMYGSGSVATSGCSVTCLAMVATYLTGHEYYPDELARYFGGRAANNIDRLEYGSTVMQLPFKRAVNIHETMEALQEGKIAIVLMESNSLFTTGQHFIILAGLTEDGKIIVNDPNEANYSKWDLEKAFRYGFEEKDILLGYSGAWIYDRSAMPEEPFLYSEPEPVRGEPRYPDIHLTLEEIRLLARVVWVEAQGECAEGQQAVAEVVLNRLASDNFPDTLYSVIYSEGQFRSVPYLDDAKPYQAQYEAIERAIYGPYVLPEEVVHFATYKTNKNVWGQIGGHIFCYDWGYEAE